MDTQEKVRENRARRAVTRRGYRLAKTRRRDHAAHDYGSWAITDPAGRVVRAALSLAEVEAWLDRGAR
jgi:hypothetical protein